MLNSKPPVSLYDKVKYAIADRKVDLLKNLIHSLPVVSEDNHASLLRTAVNFFHPEIMAVLLHSQKVDINYRDNSESTVLSSALIAGNFGATKLLLQSGAILDENHKKDKLAKSIAIRKNPEIGKLLEQAAQGKLGPLPSSQNNPELTAMSTLSIEVSASPVSTINESESVKPTEHLIGSSKKPVFFSWRSITGTLKQRIRTTNLPADIEMSSQSVDAPKQPINHPHAD